jgi:hypothetical protein
MTDDDPTSPNAGKKPSAAEKLGVPPERILRVTFSPWKWIAARGFKPLPGREIPPEYRHLFESPEPRGADENREPAPRPLEPVPSGPTDPAEAARCGKPPSRAEERIYQAMVRRGKIRRAFARDDLPDN